MRYAATCISILAVLAAAGARAQSAGSAEDRLSVFGQEISAAVDRGADLSIYASLCGVGSDAAGMQLRDAAARKVADCFRSDAKAATWSADVTTHFEGKRARLRDVAHKRGKDAVCGRLFEADGKTLSAFGKEVVADGERYAVSAASAPVAGKACP